MWLAIYLVFWLQAVATCSLVPGIPDDLDEVIFDNLEMKDLAELRLVNRYWKGKLASWVKRWLQAKVPLSMVSAVPEGHWLSLASVAEKQLPKRISPESLLSLLVQNQQAIHPAAGFRVAVRLLSVSPQLVSLLKRHNERRFLLGFVAPFLIERRNGMEDQLVLDVSGYARLELLLKKLFQLDPSLRCALQRGGDSGCVFDSFWEASETLALFHFLAKLFNQL